MATSSVLRHAFHDLSTHASIFRAKLIEEFQLLDNITDSRNVQAPVYNSRDIKDAKMLNKILSDAPNQLIKFQIFKRTIVSEAVKKADRRLNRTKNIKSLPLDAWAHWVIESNWFQYFILFVLVVGSIFFGVQTELDPEDPKNYVVLEFISLFNTFSLLIFCLEIGIRWIDNFVGFWTDGWNVFDFVVTVLSILPEVLDLLAEDANLDTALLSQVTKVSTQLRVFRILRTLKMIARFNSLKIIVMTILQAFQSIVFILILIFLACYIFAVFGVSLFQDFTFSPTQNEYQYIFSDIGQSILTLLQLLTLDNWYNIMSQVQTVSDFTVTSIYFVLWVWIGAFVFKNVFIGVMVSNFSSISEVLNQRKTDYLKRKQFEKMRKRLNRELELQTNLAKSNMSLNTTRPDNASHTTKREGSLAESSDQGDILANIQKLLIASQKESKGWDLTVAQTLTSLTNRKNETMWPRDTLFRYFQVMEALQENITEYQELQFLASAALLQLHDT